MDGASQGAKHAAGGAAGEVSKQQTKDIQPAIPFVKLYSGLSVSGKAILLVAVIGSAINGATLPVFSLIFGQLLDKFGEFQNTDELSKEVNKICLWFVWVGIITLVASYMEIGLFMLVGNSIARRLRHRYFQKTMEQDIGFFDITATTGGLMQGLNEDTLAVQNATGEKVGMFIHHIFCFCVGIGIAFWKGWDMTLVLLAVIPLMGLAGVVIAVLTNKMAAKAAVAYAKAASLATEAFSSVRTVIAFNGQAKTVQNYSQALAYPEKVGIRTGLLNGMAVGAFNFTFLCAYAVALYYGSKRIRDGAYTGGDVMNVLFAALIGGFSLGQAAPNLQYFSAGRVAGARIYQMLDRQPAIAEDPNGLALDKVHGEVELRNVTFAYPSRPEVPIFKNFQLVIPAGKTVALVGESGSGKSTVVSMVERFYDPQGGTVLLDGVDIRTLRLSWLRSQVGLVSQEPMLFAGSILQNIGYGKEGATQKEIEAAASAANAHAFISALPLGYNTLCGEKGVQLSGGQKQRIAIARAILKNPKVLLLDEATSALDSTSERIVQAALDGLMDGRTTIVVAHRLSTVQTAHMIAVVKQGQIVEQGPPRELISIPDGHYATLVKLQMAKAEADAKEGPPEGNPDEVPEAIIEADAGTEPSSFKSKPGSFKPSSFKRGKGMSFKKGGEATNGAAGEKASGKMADGGKAVKDPEVKAGWGRLISYNRPELHYGLLGAFASGVVGFVMPAFSLALSSIIGIFFVSDKGEQKRETDKWCLVFVAIAVGAFIAGSVQGWCFGKMGQRLTRRLRVMLITAVLRQEPGWFDREENNSGSVGAALGTDTAHIRGAVGDQMGLIAQNLVTIIGAFSIAFAADWRMTLVVLSCVPLIGCAVWVQGMFMMGFSNEGNDLFGKANQTASEAFSNARTVAAFTLQPQLAKVYGELLRGPDRASAKRSHVSGLGFGISNFILFAIYALSFWFGGRQVQSGKMSFEDMLKVFFSILMSAFGIQQVQLSFPDVTKAGGAVKRVFSMIDRKPLIPIDDPEGVKSGKLSGNIELRDVTFAYPARPEVTVFRNFSLQVSSGKVLALVGQSGSGKSSVISLVERFYDPLEGQVLIDGKDVRSYNLLWLRRHMALVSQEPVLFSGSIRQNICYGHDGAEMPSEEQVEAAARAANAFDFISAQPGKFDTLVGEGGIQLSGGQKQRVAIARAIIKDPRILLLDEATSALDAESERVVQDALNRTMQGRTTIIVAHRLSTIRNADTIAVVQNGTVVEQGRHAELLHNEGGAYSALVRHQQQS